MGTRRDIISGWRRNTELEQLLRDATHVGSMMIQEGGGGRLRMDDREESGQCFSCGFFGHGVNDVHDWTDRSRIKCRDGQGTYRMDSTVLHEYAETNRTSGGKKRDGSGGRVSLPDHQ